MEGRLARALWHGLEPINAVAYFAEECLDAPTRLGLKGFWMGYFACRAAPLGRVGPGVVEATFFNFHRARVERALPDAWVRTSPEAVLDARAVAAALALRRVLPDGGADTLATAVLPTLLAVIDEAEPAGRPLFAANRDVQRPDDSVAALWQAATTLREHRGDSHVALLTAAGLSGCEALALFAATEGLPATMFQASRGWSAEEWTTACEGLADRGLLGGDGNPNDAGRQLHDDIERRTDELALAPYARIDSDTIDQLLALLEGPARVIAGAGDITYPNPMGLPPPASTA